MHTQHVQSHTEGEQIPVYQEGIRGMSEGNSLALECREKGSPSLSEGASRLRPRSTRSDSQPDHFSTHDDQAVGTTLAVLGKLELLSKESGGSFEEAGELTFSLYLLGTLGEAVSLQTVN